MLKEILSNPVFVVAFWAWFLAQALKIPMTYIIYRKLDWSRITGSGGMPSSHSSLVTGLTMAIGLIEGFDSSMFALSLGIAAIIMYDAAGVRYAVGTQAKILNQMMEDIHNHNFEVGRLKELVGHTPKEVIVGAILGVVVALVLI